MTALDTAAAFDRLYRREHQRLLRYAGQKIGPEDASDVAQDAFMRLLDGELFAKVENPRAYLTRIARNLSVDRTRRQTRDRVASYRLLLGRDGAACPDQTLRSEEHTSELQSLMRISYAVFCLKKKTNNITQHTE